MVVESTSSPCARIPGNDVPNLVALDAASKHAHKDSHNTLSTLHLCLLPDPVKQALNSGKYVLHTKVVVIRPPEMTQSTATTACTPGSEHDCSWADERISHSLCC